MNSRYTVLAAAVAAATFALPVNATVISTLFNTGVDASKVSVGGVGSVDQHWTLAENEGPAYVSGQNGVFPLGPWIVDDSVSRWITPTPLAGDTLNPTADGTYNYSLAFSLAGLRAGQASLKGRFAADNGVLGITLNGTPINGSGGGFTDWTAFSSVAGSFVAGINVLTFRVSNFGQAEGNPSGLRVELSGTDSVPEPASWALMIVGFGMVGVAARRRKAALAA